MEHDPYPRRHFFSQLGGLAGAAWLRASWPALLAAAQHAHEAVRSPSERKLRVLSPDQARELEALASQIIPTDDLPGAREAGVIYFIDRALETFAKEDLSIYEQGIRTVNQLTQSTFPSIQRFSDASSEQQLQIFSALAGHWDARRDPFSGDSSAAGSTFLSTLWHHTVFGFLLVPEAGGNFDYAGWKLIGRDPAPSFSPPFGYYDRDYPGWQPAPAKPEKP